MIKYRIDTTEKEYHTIEGTVVHIAAVEEYGVFLGYKNDGRREEDLSLGNINCLDALVDVWGDDLYVSQGLFISAALAWDGIGEFVKTGKLLKDIEWIETDKIPEERNYVI